MGRKGRKGQGTNNPLLLRKLKAQSRPQAKSTTIKDYLSRPRPTLDEIHRIMKERDAKNLQLERWETEMGRNWRASLDENRAQVMKERLEKAKQAKKQIKEARKEEKRLAKLKRRLRKGKLSEDEIKDYRRRKRKFKKRLGEMQLSQWLNQAEDSDEDDKANAGAPGEGQEGEGDEPPLKRPKVAWVFKDNATQTQWKKEKENGHVVQETNPAPVLNAIAREGKDYGESGASGGAMVRLPLGMAPSQLSGVALMLHQQQRNRHAQIQMIQQQIIKLQEVLASQPLLQIDQRVQMQRQIIILQQQMQLHLQRPQPFLGASIPLPFPPSMMMFGRALPMGLPLLRHPLALPTVVHPGSNATAITPTTTAPTGTVTEDTVPSEAAAAASVTRPMGRPKRVFAMTQEASQSCAVPMQPSQPTSPPPRPHVDPERDRV